MARRLGPKACAPRRSTRPLPVLADLLLAGHVITFHEPPVKLAGHLIAALAKDEQGVVVNGGDRRLTRLGTQWRFARS